MWENLPNPERKQRITNWITEVDRNSILEAISVFDELGPAGVKKTFGFEFPKGYAVKHKSRLYPWRALVGIAHQIKNAGALTPKDCGPLQGGRVLVEEHLGRRLGFEIQDI